MSSHFLTKLNTKILTKIRKKKIKSAKGRNVCNTINNSKKKKLFLQLRVYGSLHIFDISFITRPFQFSQEFVAVSSIS